MNTIDNEQSPSTFQDLTPDRILTLVEQALGIRCDNLCRPMASYINRVYELQSEDGDRLVAKFYRPGRWSFAALRDEHDFLQDLAVEEIPVIAPFTLRDGSTLATHDDIYFAVFPKKGGRVVDEFSEDQLIEFGHLIGRVHAVGAAQPPAADRITMTPDTSTVDQVKYILDHDLIPSHMRGQYQDTVNELIDEIKPLFEGVKMTRIHGDCHFGNLIYRPGESFYLIDFDDMANGPAVQDIWMLLPDYRENVGAEIEFILEGYETFHHFDRRELRLIEPLRAMRFIHYSAWCAHQVLADGASKIVPDFGTHNYWQREINDLKDQLVHIQDTTEQNGNY